jgi:hypothetical protein
MTTDQPLCVGRRTEPLVSGWSIADTRSRGEWVSGDDRVGAGSGAGRSAQPASKADSVIAKIAARFI